MARESTSEAIYAGTFERSMDAKNRVTIPSEWLREEGAAFHTIPSANGEFLVVMPPAEFDEIEGRIQASEAPAMEKRVAIRQFYGAARLVTTDKQGRILLPDEHCKRTGLGGEVVMLGSRSRFEIWSTARWSKAASEEAPIYQKVADMIGL